MSSSALKSSEAQNIRKNLSREEKIDELDNLDTESYLEYLRNSNQRKEDSEAERTLVDISRGLEYAEFDEKRIRNVLDEGDHIVMSRSQYFGPNFVSADIPSDYKAGEDIFVEENRVYITNL